MGKTNIVLSMAVVLVCAAPAMWAATGSGTSGSFSLPSGCSPSSGPKPVVVLVRGAGLWQSGNSTYWEDLEPKLKSAGYTVWRCDGINPKGRIEHNGRALADYIDAQVASAGAPASIALVAHSMGGLISRYYLSQYGATGNGKKVKTLVTLGTPHCGSQLAHGATWWLTEDSEGYAQLTENYCTQDFNKKHTGTAYARLFFLAGNGGSTSGKSAFVSGDKKLRGRPKCTSSNISDGDVTVRSAHGRYLTSGCADTKQVSASRSSSGREFLYVYDGADHNEMKYGDDTGTPPSAILSDLLSILNGAAPEPPVTAYAAGGVSLASAEPAWSNVAVLTDAVEQSGIKTHWVPVDLGVAAEFVCHTTDADTEVTLIAPGGARITADTIDPSVDFEETWDQDGRDKSFVVSSPAPGNWGIEVRGVSVPVSPEAYFVRVSIQSDLTLRPTSSYVNSSAAPVVISASVNNAAAPVPGQTVTATISGSPGVTSTIDLLDDGLHSDGAAADGLYANTWSCTQTGFYALKLSGTGNAVGNAFQRLEVTDLQVSAPTASLSGSYSDAAVDADTAKPGIDTLRVQVGLDVSEGAKFTVAGALVKDGEVIARSALSRTDLVLGSNTVALDFNGADIRAVGIPGPYVLSDITVFDDTADPPLIVQQSPGGYLTQVSDQGIFNDGTPPTPIVDLAASETSLSSVTLTWSSPADDTAVVGYELRVGPEPVNDGTWQQSVQLSGLPEPVAANQPQSATIDGLASGVYFFGIRSVDAAGNWSPVSNSPMAVLLPALDPSASQTGQRVVIEGIVTDVSGTYSDRICVQSAAAPWGVWAAMPAAAAPEVGDLASVSGSLSVVDGERQLSQTGYFRLDAAVPGPLTMTGRSVGGQAAGADAPGVTGGFGLNNSGALVKVAGRVTFVDPGGAYFTLSDRSNWTGIPLQDSSGNPGIRVSLASGAPAPALDSFVIVTGISGSYSASGQLWPIVRTRSAEDIVGQ